MNQYNIFRPETLAVHAGQAARSADIVPNTGAAPLCFTSGFIFADTDQAEALFNLEQPGHPHSSISNPTSAILEERVSALEHGVGAIAAASGQAALHMAIATLIDSGGHIVAANTLRPGSHSLLAHTLPRFGITCTFVNPRDSDAWQGAIRTETRLLFGESLDSAGLNVLDIPAVAGIAHAAHLPLLVDATFVSPWLQRPFDAGADLIVHSATEFLGGHGVAVGGLVVDSGAFDWHRSGLFPTLTEPCEAIHGIGFAETSPIAAFLLRARHEGLHDFGAALSPVNAFQILQGIETLPLRMPVHVANAKAVAEHLASQALIADVRYAGLTEHPDHALAERLLPRGAGAMLSFDLCGGNKAVRTFIQALRLFSLSASAGDSRSRAIPPAATICSRMSREELNHRKIGEGTIHLSIGLENSDDLIEDINRALHAVKRATGG